MQQGDNDLTRVDSPQGEPALEFPIGEKIDQFTLRELLGRGGFGVVYLAHDEILHRDVALKVPHRELLKTGKHKDSYLREARAIAALDHPHIIPVYHAASSTNCECYIVTKYIAGQQLGKWVRQNDPTYQQIAMLVAQIADALAYAHSKSIVHRDIKPSNVMVDKANCPYVADFGLALREADPEAGLAYIGTAPYMSPEQARGEGHRVDGRSDTFSLGIVLYELLAGQRPFRHQDRSKLYQAIQFEEPESLRALRSGMPNELERICFKALSKAVRQRYPTASEMADELREFAENSRGVSTLTLSSLELTQALSEADTNRTSQAPTTKAHSSRLSKAVASQDSSHRLWLPIVPKGLRAFDFGDSEFYLQMVPGPRDRDGIPELIRFWKSRIEGIPNEASPSIGVLFGPSGCGKTSLVRAGIMPRLSANIDAIYVEATAVGSEAKILEMLRRSKQLQSPTTNIPIDEQLVATFTRLRRLGSSKTVLFIDQFEQWLFAHPDLERQPLTQALRQCDGENLQCILMVRDDFWMGLTRMMRSLELTVSERHNSMAVDLFDRRHARQVLAMFGQAFGRLPADLNAFSAAENRFLDAAIDYLAVDGRVVCVQLALLAEIVKNRPWNNREVSFQGGGLGLGVRFLEDTFDADTAQRRHRQHAEAAARVLRRLLPESVSRIKGSLCSEQELVEASDYRDPPAFRELLRILDNELHLITPTDRMTSDRLSVDQGHSHGPETGYQLTHDFLITPIRQWLELRYLGTRDGQAQARLEEFSELFHARPKAQSLPSMFEYCNLRWRIPRTDWSEQQTKMMQAAGALHTRKLMLTMAGLTFGLLVMVLGWNSIRQQQRRQAADSEIRRLVTAEFSAAVPIMRGLRQSADERSLLHLRGLVQDSVAPISERVRAALVVAPQATEATELLTNYLLDDQQPLAEAIQICKLQPEQKWLDQATLLASWNDKNQRSGVRLRAALGLAQFEPLDDSLAASLDQIAELLVQEQQLSMSQWLLGFERMGSLLVPSLSARFHSSDSNNRAACINSAILLGRFARNEPDRLVKLIPSARPDQLVYLVEALRDQRLGLELLATEIQRHQPRPGTNDLWRTGFRIDRWWNKTPTDLQAWQSKLAKDDGLQAEFNRYSAIVGNGSVIVPALPSDQLESLVQRLREHGLRIADVCSFGSIDDTQLNVLWQVDERPSKYLINVDADRLKAANAQYRQEGYYPSHVSAHSFDDFQSFVYCAVWTEGMPFPVVGDADMYVEVSAAEHQQGGGWEPFARRGFVPKCNLLTQTRNGSETHTSIRWRLRDPSNYQDSWNMSLSAFQDWQSGSPSAAQIQAVLSHRAPNDADRGMTAVWWSGTPVRSHWTNYLSQADHQRECERLLKLGCRPVSITATLTGTDKTMQYGSTWWEPLDPHTEETELHIQQSRRVLAMHLLGNSEPLAEALTSDSEPELRANLIDSFQRYNIDPKYLLDKLLDTRAAAQLRRGAALALALYPLPSWKPAEAMQWSQFLENAREQIVDPGLRSAIEAICTRWNWKTPSWMPVTEREYQTLSGQRMIRLSTKGAIWQGSPATEEGRDQLKEEQHQVAIDRTFAIADREVTIAQFREFSPGYDYPRDHMVSDQSPAINVDWYQAVRYCRWLSEKEGLPESEMCYPKIDEIVAGMRLADDLHKRQGYRLPTEAEWEYACRAGTQTSRHFGHAPHLLNNYAWTFLNSNSLAQPVGGKLPNDWGFFDLLGNCLEWCHNEQAGYPWNRPGVNEDLPSENSLWLEDSKQRITRGGAFLYRPLDARSAHRNYQRSTDKRVYMTFRIARTMMDPVTTKPR